MRAHCKDSGDVDTDIKHQRLVCHPALVPSRQAHPLHHTLTVTGTTLYCVVLQVRYACTAPAVYPRGSYAEPGALLLQAVTYTHKKSNGKHTRPSGRLIAFGSWAPSLELQVRLCLKQVGTSQKRLLMREPTATVPEVQLQGAHRPGLLGWLHCFHKHRQTH